MKHILFFALLSFYFISCKKSNNCDLDTIKNDATFQKAKAEGYSIINTSITDDCLYVDISSSGCSGDTWEVNLVGEESVAKSYPPIRQVKLSLINKELCDAIVRKSYSFNLIPLRARNIDSIYLDIDGLDNNLLYSY